MNAVAIAANGVRSRQMQVYVAPSSAKISNLQDAGLGDEEESEYTIRQLVWSSECCNLYPYPFLLAIADHPTQYGFESYVAVYYYVSATNEFNLLAETTLPGKIFAGQFTPGCNCKSVTVGGGCLTCQDLAQQIFGT